MRLRNIGRMVCLSASGHAQCLEVMTLEYLGNNIDIMRRQLDALMSDGKTQR
jgi:hypothetical protein